MQSVLKWISEQEKGAQTEVAVFHHDSPFGTSPLEDGKKYIEENKLKIGYKTYAMRAGATDFVPELSQAKSQGAKYIIIQNVPSPASKLLQNIKSQGLQVQTVCLNYCGDELLVRLAGDAAEGVVGSMPFAPPAADSPGLRDINEFLTGKGQKLDDKFPPLRYVQGWFTSKVFLEGVMKAAGEGEIKGDAIRQSLETIKDFQTDVGPPITFTAEDHSGMDGVPLYKVQGGVWTKLVDELKP
jgi:branched-chain amino acid transport system substrate-binding protein